MPAMHIVISDHDESEVSEITTTTTLLIATATVLPNTSQFIDDNGMRVLHVAKGDLQRHPEIAEEIHELTHEYEQLLE